MRALAAALVAARVASNMIDVVEPAMAAPVNCTHGCATWANLAGSFNKASQAAVNALWASPAQLAAAGSSCAIPGNWGVPDSAVCYCAGTATQPSSAWARCADPVVPSPQQVFLQHGATQDELIVSFTTVVAAGGPRRLRAGPGAGASPPRVELCRAGGSCVTTNGTTTLYSEAQHTARVYAFHFVVLPPALLAPGVTYTYRCHSGDAGGAWSPEFTFVRPAAAAPLRFALFGDMGLYPFNNIGNLVNDVDAGRIGAVVHLGDHAYNLAMDGGTRGDGYFIAMQRVLSRVPMVSVVGNHEHEGSPFGAYCSEATYCEGRYLNQTAAQLVTGRASGSNSSLYFSIDLGPPGAGIHIVVLDTMFYLGLDGVHAEQLVSV